MKYVFFNVQENRLRAGWRIVLFMLAVMAVSAIPQFTAIWIIGGKPAPGFGRDLLLIGIAATVVTLLLPLARKWIDKRSLAALGLKWDRFAIKDLIFGWTLSGLMAASFFAILVSSGRLEVTGFAWTTSAVLLPLLGYFLLHVLVGWWEELFFRGYLFDNMVAGMGLLVAIIISCILYGLIHAINPNATLLSTLIIVGFGYLRLYGLLSTKQLWLSMGMHMGWNFFQGPIFGFAASGHATFKLIEHTTTGSDSISGGEFGPEGSLLMIPILVITLGVMYLWSKRRSKDSVPAELTAGPVKHLT